MLVYDCCESTRLSTNVDVNNHVAVVSLGENVRMIARLQMLVYDCCESTRLSTNVDVNKHVAVVSLGENVRMIARL